MSWLTPYERFSRRIKGKPVDRSPNFDILMTFSAHYIGQPLKEYYLDHRVLAEANLAVQEAFDLDIVQVISDPYREAVDFGLKVEFPEDDLPIARQPLLSVPDDLARLSSPDPGSGERMSDRLDAIHYLRQRVGGSVPIMGWVEGALAEAADLRGVLNLMKDLYSRPEWVSDLLDHILQVELEFAKAQIEAGADIIGLGDAIASQISAVMYRQFALPYEMQIFNLVREMGAISRLHICGNTTHILREMVESGADIIDIDWMVDIEDAVGAFDGKAALCGNFDPVAVMLQGSTEDVHNAVISCQEKGGSRYFSAAGCEIPDMTPQKNMLTQSRALRDSGSNQR